MEIKKFQELLNQINQERFETKVLNILLANYEEFTQLKTMVVQLQEKMNEIIDEINGQEDAEALNSDVEVYEPEKDIIVEDTGAANVTEIVE